MTNKEKLTHLFKMREMCNELEDTIGEDIYQYITDKIGDFCKDNKIDYMIIKEAMDKGGNTNMDEIFDTDMVIDERGDVLEQKRMEAELIVNEEDLL